MFVACFRYTYAIIADGYGVTFCTDLGIKINKVLAPEYLMALLIRLTMQHFNKFRSPGQTIGAGMLVDDFWCRLATNCISAVICSDN